MDQNEVNGLLQRPKPNDALTLRAYRIIGRWLEWARMHGHLDHAEGIVKDSRDLLSANMTPQPPASSRCRRTTPFTRGTTKR